MVRFTVFHRGPPVSQRYTPYRTMSRVSFKDECEPPTQCETINPTRFFYSFFLELSAKVTLPIESLSKSAH
jgi:hypothetical protein